MYLHRAGINFDYFPPPPASSRAVNVFFGFLQFHRNFGIKSITLAKLNTKLNLPQTTLIGYS